MIENVFRKDVVIISQDKCVDAVVNLMVEKQVGCVVVVDSEDLMPMPVGILTDRDVLLRVTAKDLSLDKTKILDVMTKDVVTASADTTMYKVLGIMRLNGVRRLPLVNAQGELVGIITLDDMLNFLADEFNHLAELIRCNTKRSVW